jgi:cell division protein ZipA
MSELRWILLAAAVLIVAYVYWRGRAEQRRRKRASDTRIEPIVRPADETLDQLVVDRREPTLGALDDVIDVDQSDVQSGAGADWRVSPAPSRVAPIPVEGSDIGRRVQQGLRRTPPSQAARRDNAPAAPAQKIVALRIARRGGQRIPGAVLVESLHREGLEYGEYRIFHRYEEPADGGARAPLFSVANMVEPGELDPAGAQDLDLSGITMFMVLPGPKSGPAALTEMLGTARRVAAALNAELLDQHGSTMTRQTADHLRDEIVEFEHRHRGGHQTAQDR